MSETQTFQIVNRKSCYGDYWSTVICTDKNRVEPTERYPEQHVIATLEATDRDTAAYQWAKQAIEEWNAKSVEEREGTYPGYRMGNDSLHSFNLAAPLFVKVVNRFKNGAYGEDDDRGDEIHYVLLDTYQNVIYALTGTHNPCFGSHSMSARPAYYSGRGPNRGDCGPDHLKRLHDGLKTYFGDDHAEAFARMVASQNDLSATSFLIAFQKFWYGGCQWGDIKPETNPNFEITSRWEDNPAQAMGEGFATIMSSMFDTRSEGARSWESDSIKSEFLRAIDRIELMPKANSRSEYTYSEWL